MASASPVLSAILVIALFSLSLPLVLAAPFEVRSESPERFPFHSRDNLPAGWNLSDRPSTSELHTITVAVAHLPSQRAELEKYFWAVSDPKSDVYGKYLSNDQITELVAPSTHVRSLFVQWFRSVGIKNDSIQWSANFDLISVTSTVENIQKLTEARLHRFQHTHSGKSVLRSLDEYTVPVELKQHIAFIGGLHRFPPVPKVAAKALAPASDAPVSAFIQPGNEDLGLFIALRCQDGSFSPCSNSVDKPSKVEYTLNGPDGNVLVQETVAVENSATCKPCSGWVGVFAEKCSSLSGASSSTTFCNQKFSDLPNYVSINPTIVTTFVSGHLSAALKFPFPVILSEWVTPQSLKEWYNIPVGLSNRSTKNSQAVAEFLKQYYSPQDLVQFFSLMGLKNEADKVAIKGPNIASQPGGEASLDIQYIMGISTNIATTFWSTSGLNPDQQEPFLAWMTDIQNDNKPPLVHSVSYDDQEDMIAKSYMDRVNTEFVKAGTRGLTLLFAAGDDGAAGYLCRSKLSECQNLSPAWPSSSPYVTAVGGTQFSKDVYPWCKLPGKVCSAVGEITSSTTTGSRITTGGGFSTLFSRPSYQSEFVNAYLPSAGVPTKYFNATGRAYPDISGIAHNYLVVLSGELIPVDGTSASTPLVAAMIALLNDKLLVRGGTPLGFVNPFLYQMAGSFPEVFNDVVMGNNACSANPTNCAPYGFEAAPGYDAVTGLGSINFEELAKHLPL